MGKQKHFSIIEIFKHFIITKHHDQLNKYFLSCLNSFAYYSTISKIYKLSIRKLKFKKGNKSQNTSTQVQIEYIQTRGKIKKSEIEAQTKVLAQNFQPTLAAVFLSNKSEELSARVFDLRAILLYKNSSRSRRNYFSCESTYPSLSG